MKIQRKTLVWGTLALLGAAGLLAWAFAPRPTEVEVAVVTQGPFETTLDEDGQTRLRERYLVAAPLAGRLARITLREGDTVEAGATLATITPAMSPLLDERSSLELNARVNTAQAVVQRAATRIERARLALVQARSEQQRDEPLAAQGYIAPTRLDDLRRAVQAAQSDLDTAVIEREVAVRELAQARAAVQAQRDGAGAGRGAGGFAVRAPVTGRVLRVPQTSETMVTLGTPLLELGDTRRLEVVAELLTSDALQIPAGAAVRIERWGGAGELTGRVRRIEPAAFTKVSALGVEEQRVKVLIDLTSAPAQWSALGEAFRVGVRIVTRSVPQALQVPVSAVFPRGAAGAATPAASMAATSAAASGSTPQATAGLTAPADTTPMAVYAVQDGDARWVPVELVARNGRHAWIHRGLQAGQTVIVYPPATLRDGQRVQPRRV